MIKKLRSIFSAQTTKDTLISFTGLGTIAVVGMLFTVIMARALGPTMFGVFSALSALVALLSSVGDLGLSSALVNFIPKLTDRRDVIISTVFWIQIVVSLILALALSLLGLKPDLVIPGSTTAHYLIIGLLTGLYVLQGFALGVFNSEKKFFSASILQGSDSVIKLTIVAGLFFTNSVNIEYAMLANVVSCLLSVFYGLGKELKNIRPIFPKAQVMEIFHFAKWIALSRAFSVMISRVDIILLNLLSGGFQAGIFSAASRIALLFSLLVSSLSSVVAPRFSAFNKHDEMLLYLKKVALMIGGVSLLMLFTIAIADPLVPWIFGDKYLPAIPVFRAMTIAMIPFLLNVVTTQPLIYYFNRPQIFAKVTILQVAVIITLDLLLIPRYQAIAPTISMGIANLIVFIITGSYLLKSISKACVPFR